MKIKRCRRDDDHHMLPTSLYPQVDRAPLYQKKSYAYNETVHMRAAASSITAHRKIIPFSLCKRGLSFTVPLNTQDLHPVAFKGNKPTLRI